MLGFRGQFIGSFQLEEAILAALSPDRPKDTLDILRDAKQYIHEKVLKEAQARLAEIQKQMGPGYMGGIEVSQEDINTKIHYDVVVNKLLVLVKQNRAKEVAPDKYIRI